LRLFRCLQVAQPSFLVIIEWIGVIGHFSFVFSS
jgi:hypothetical protein